MSLLNLKNKNYTVLFIIFDCKGNEGQVFAHPKQEEFKKVFKSLGLPEHIYFFPPMPFPKNDFQVVFKNAVSKTEINTNFNLFKKKLLSNLLLEALKYPVPALCSPIVFFNGISDSDSYLYRIRGENLNRLIPEADMRAIEKLLEIRTLSDLKIIKDDCKPLHLKTK